MIYVVNDSDNPFFNHAIEEYIIKNIEEDAFILWRNRPSILIGRNQNTLTEIDYEYVRQEKIDVVRRLSGGGTVFNDLGNINFTFITKKAQDGSSLSNGFEKFAFPVIKALQSLGVNAVFTGRNDITIDEKKFSGNAQYHYKDKTLHHGTLLFSGNLERLAKALKSKPLKLQDKGVKSVRSRVTNISEHLKSPMNVIEFKEYLKKYIMDFHNI
ncbi:MAG: lipoate--protein ligase family protein, partial [Eubacteriales bacterium]|nr:lipoate--protein ligase family protein [Eubacteriales bacterium]